ncbi:MAG: ABC transporter permease, partial [Candidatus Heimdallarchaeota archaeon]
MRKENETKDTHKDAIEAKSDEFEHTEKDNYEGSRIQFFFKETKSGRYFWTILKTLFPFVVVGLLYEIIVLILNATVPVLDSHILPPLHDIIAYAWTAFFPGKESLVTSVGFDIGRSFLRVLIGFGIGTLSGILMGILMGLSKWLHRLFNPIFSLMISIPTLAWVPILLIILGLTPKTIIVTIALSCFFPIVYSTTNGIRSIDKKLIWAAQIMGANRFEIFMDVFLPGSLVSLISGLRLAIGYSWRAVVGAEILV